MLLTRYQITLKRLTINEIELVREHRNSTLIRQTMEYREEITPEMQLKWFNSINNANNIYLLVKYKGEYIGLLNAKDINWETHEMESGIFLWEEKYYESFVPAILSLMVTDMCINLFGWDTIQAHILKSNSRAISFNKMLGYELCEGQEDIENQKYILTAENFFKKTKRIRKAITALFPDEGFVKFVVEPHDFINDFGDFYIEKINQNTTILDKKEFGEKSIEYTLKVANL